VSGAALAALLAAIAVFASLADRAPASAAGLMTLSARSDAPGRITLAVSDPGGTAVEVSEQVAGRAAALGHIAVANGAGRLAAAVAWRCDRRTRRFTATSTHADGSVASAVTTITTPSCARRLHTIVVPAQLRPGQSAVVRISDAWHLGGFAGRVCARSGQAPASCRSVRPRASGAAIVRLRLARAGRWTIALRTAYGTASSRTVDARADARLRLLVTGDSLVYGIFEDLRSVLGDRALVRGDPNPATGISKPIGLDWVAHAKAIAAAARPDVTVVFLGGSEGFALKPQGAAAIACCGPDWSAEYARRVTKMMTSLQRDGRGLVYWVLLPAARSPTMAAAFRAVNVGIRQAAAGFDDGVHALDRLANVIAPGDVFEQSIRYKGRLRVVREPDGFHLAPAGVHIAMGTILEQLRADGLLR
jgi:hypothetical protein